MKFKLIDRDKKEFARYCPTFARSYCSMKEGLRKLAEARNTRRLARDLSNEDVYVRKGAVTNLNTAALNNEDISAAIPALGKALGDVDVDVRREAAYAIGEAAWEGADMAAAIPLLADALGDRDARVKWNAVCALEFAALKGKDIAAAIPALAKAFADKDMGADVNVNVGEKATEVLWKAAEKGADITAAIPALVRMLGNESIVTRYDVLKTLEKAVNYETENYGDQKTRTLTVNGIIEFTRSDWFRSEMGRNSVEYEKIATTIAQLLDKMRDAERKAA